MSSNDESSNDTTNEEAASLPETIYFEEDGAYVAIGQRQVVVSGAREPVKAYLTRFFDQYDDVVVWHMMVLEEPRDPKADCSGDGSEASGSGPQNVEILLQSVLFPMGSRTSLQTYIMQQADIRHDQYTYRSSHRLTSLAPP
ncbi:hypothetical protein M0657_009601 [Pyricularia oryzae]|nr:hypothetical protein M0657_009601 [Pyricularia oryzae]